jgi:hypothetical protein
MKVTRNFLVLLSAFVFFLLLSRTARAQVTFDGCVDIRGVPVASIPDRTLNDIAMASEDAYGRPIIRYNAFVVITAHPQTRLFFYAHECGHHALGHPLQGPAMGQEQAADCWAINTLVRKRLVSSADISIIQGDIARFGVGDWSHLPGPQRAINLARCLQASRSNQDSDSDPDSNTKPDATRSVRSNRCSKDYEECMDDVPSLDDCMDKRQESCMNDCLGRFHYPYAACEQRFCNPQFGSNTSWAAACRRKISDAKKECKNTQRSCESDDNDSH